MNIEQAKLVTLTNILSSLGDANTELEQMIMYLETFKIVCYHLILSALYEYRFPESFSLI